MTDKQLKKIQNLILDMAVVVKNICEKENIKYFIISGSLLGAVRHKGFIPWDDDMDIGMLREDYEKFLQVCDKYLDKEKYYLQTMRTHKNFALTFAKIRLKGTLFLESMTYKTSNNNEIFIDIIPYDNAPEGSIKRFVHSKSIYIKKHLLWSKVGYDPNPDSYFKKSLYVISNFLSKFCSRNKLKKSLEKALMKYNGNVSEYVFSNGAYPYNKETLKREWVTDLVLYRFENEAFLGAKDYKGVLEHLYGDYMKIPDESDRNTHGVIKVDFGKY